MKKHCLPFHEDKVGRQAVPCENSNPFSIAASSPRRRTRLMVVSPLRQN
jgi:hypothetical protein